MAETKTLASISEYGEDSRATSYTGLSDNSYSIGYTRSNSSNSLETLTTTTTNRSYKNGYNGERKTVDTSMTNAQRRRDKTMAQKRNYELCKKVRVSMALCGILLLVAAIFMLSFYLPKQYAKKKYNKEGEKKNKRVIWDDNIEIEKDLIVLFSTNFSDPILKSEVGPDIALKGYFGEFLSDASRKEFFDKVNKGNDSISMTFQEEDSHTSLTISKVDFHDQCYQVHWTTKKDQRLQDCFDTDNVHWFGLGETFLQVWPTNKVSFKMTPFLTNDYLGMGGNEKSAFGGVIEPFAVNSKGAGIYVSETVNLHVGMNENKEKKFCLRADSRSCEFNDLDKDKNQTNELIYTICVAENIKKVHKIMFDQFIEKPKGVPDMRMIKEPIWSTWANFKKNINQSIILQFAENIKKHKFESSHIIIDDKYSTNYGDFNFNPDKFDDVSNMINRLRSYGFRTLVWMTPFTNLESKHFIEGIKYWVKVGSKEQVAPGIVEWWNGQGGVLDTTNKAGKYWFLKRLEDFLKLNLDGFKFDGGEVTTLPAHHILKESVRNPNYYTYYYVELASQFALSEVRVGYKSQKFPVFVRLLDRRSDWDSQGGLRSVLSAALTFSILGYSFIIPDMVGGNHYIRQPNKELYVRWAQLCAFLPSIQFSIPPWQFNDEVVTIVRDVLEIRSNLSDYIYALATNVSITGEPIIRPLWWYWPKDPDAFVIDDEFMLGDKYLIAPVLNPNMISNAIFLPAGVWEEQWGEKKTINNTVGKFYHYQVDLSTVCYFKLLEFLSPIT